MSSQRPVMGLLTDFGLDGAAAACKGVILSICRDAQIVDISHTVRKYAIRDGAYIMRNVLPHLPVGHHIGVIDPGVGTSRRPVAVSTGRGDVLVGPDNGLFGPAAAVLGGVAAARQLDNRALWLPVTTSTFHGRDIFSPVAAHLAAGDAPFAEVGPELDPATLVTLALPRPTVREGAIETEVTYVDSFGNVRLAGRAGDLAAAFGDVRDGRAFGVELPDGATPARQAAAFATSFGHVPEGATLLYVDSSGNLAVADNRGNLAARLDVAAGRRVRITTA